ncbi:hypothetical protein ACAF76_014985 [Brevibacillus sp. TJ4]|uniref:hypothetical protein n=1 Tax=Brevibacillus sp. TJ4 TaxID=3234853 RepID=UPI0037CF6DAE
MESFSDSLERGQGKKAEARTLQIGDQVVYRRDGTRGIVYAKNGELCQVVWEDEFVSWEQSEALYRL